MPLQRTAYEKGVRMSQEVMPEKTVAAVAAEGCGGNCQGDVTTYAAKWYPGAKSQK